MEIIFRLDKKSIYQVLLKEPALSGPIERTSFISNWYTGNNICHMKEETIAHFIEWVSLGQQIRKI